VIVFCIGIPLQEPTQCLDIQLSRFNHHPLPRKRSARPLSRVTFGRYASQPRLHAQAIRSDGRAIICTSGWESTPQGNRPRISWKAGESVVALRGRHTSAWQCIPLSYPERTWVLVIRPTSFLLFGPRGPWLLRMWDNTSKRKQTKKPPHTRGLLG